MHAEVLENFLQFILSVKRKIALLASQLLFQLHFRPNYLELVPEPAVFFGSVQNGHRLSFEKWLTLFSGLLLLQFCI